MPLPNPQYVQMVNLQTYFVNKDTGAPLSGGYLLFFEDEARTIPKSVYVQTQSPGPIYAYTDIGSQVTLSAVGTTQYLGTDSLVFLYPYDASGNPQLYYIEVFSSDNILQFTRSAYPSGISNSGSGTSGFSQSENIISNPQFSRVLFNPAGIVFNVTGTQTTPIAPDWNIITTGTGTVTVKQVAITDAAAPGEPAYALDITSASINTLVLSQRITNSPRILENNFASGTFIAEAIAPTSNAIITMNYVPSVGSSIPIVVGSALPGVFTAYVGTTSAVIPQANTNPPGSTGYVDIQFVIPVGAHVEISCIQLLSVLNGSIVVGYIQESTPRQIDHLFHYYEAGLNFKPIPSLLVGWDFPLNPAQLGTSQTITTTPKYIWDQTICGSVVGNVTVIRVSSTGAFSATTNNANESFYLLQYLSGAEAIETTLSNLSVSINAYSLVNSNVTVNVYLYSTLAGAVIPPLTGTPGTIGTIAASGVFSLNVTTGACWSLIPQFGQNSSGTLSVNTLFNNNLEFSGWNGKSSVSLSNPVSFAIVVTFSCPTSGTQVLIQSISLVPGDIPTIPAPQTSDEVLAECEYYYEKSYNTLDVAGTPATYPGSVISNQNAVIDGANIALFATPFTIVFNRVKRAVPLIFTFSPISGNGANVAAYTYSNGVNRATADLSLTNWTTPYKGTKSIYFVPANTLELIPAAGVSSVNPQAYIAYQWDADSRLGIVT
jgi:hypothetical protein